MPKKNKKLGFGSKTVNGRDIQDTFLPVLHQFKSNLLVCLCTRAACANPVHVLYVCVFF